MQTFPQSLEEVQSVNLKNNFMDKIQKNSDFAILLCIIILLCLDNIRQKDINEKKCWLNFTFSPLMQDKDSCDRYTCFSKQHIDHWSQVWLTVNSQQLNNQTVKYSNSQSSKESIVKKSNRKTVKKSLISQIVKVEKPNNEHSNSQHSTVKDSNSQTVK